MAWSQKQNNQYGELNKRGETRGITKHSSDQYEKCLLDRRDLNSVCSGVCEWVEKAFENFEKKYIWMMNPEVFDQRC